MKVTIYQTSACPRCHELDAFLQEHRDDLPAFEYGSRDMEDPAQLSLARSEDGVFIKECPALLINNMQLTANVLWKDGKLRKDYVIDHIKIGAKE